MKTYKVTAQNITYFYATIEAESYEQAQEIANHLDGATFEDSGYGDWEIVSVEQEATK